MGGCRCTFRDCKNNTVIAPGMHFFHFPFKDIERCKKWALHSGKLEFLQLPKNKLRNKVVCEEHFHDNCFMNYKKERLIKTAVPTLLKTSDGDVMDYEYDDSATEKIEYPVKENEECEIAITLPTEPLSYNNRQHITNVPPEISVEHTDVGMMIDLEPASGLIVENFTLTEPKVLNTLISENAIHFGKFELTPLRTHIIKRREVVNGLQAKKAQTEQVYDIVGQSNTVNSGDVVETLNIEIEDPPVDAKPQAIGNKRVYKRKINENVEDKEKHLKKVQISTHNLPTSTVTVRDNEVEPVAKAVFKPPSAGKARSQGDMVKLKVDSVELPSKFRAKELESSAVQKPAVKDPDTIDKALYLQTMSDHRNQIEELKKMLSDKLTKDESQSSAVPTSSSSAVRQVKIEKGPQLTKIQLFNGIRKYLNPTMVALLRMEMFGGPERPYRPDEKQFSKELLNLNENVYDYMKDEWRFRLPPKSDVEAWLKEQDDDETWEIC